MLEGSTKLTCYHTSLTVPAIAVGAGVASAGIEIMAKLASSRPTLHFSEQQESLKSHQTKKFKEKLQQLADPKCIEEVEHATEDDIGTLLEEKVDKAINDLELWWKEDVASQWKQTRRLRKTQHLLQVLDAHTKALACLPRDKKRCVGQWRRMAKVTRIIKRSERVMERRL